MTAPADEWAAIDREPDEQAPLAQPTPASLPIEPTPAAAFNLSDYGNAERLVARHGQDLRYCPTWGAWLYWDGNRWPVDETGEVMRRAKETTRALFVEAGRADDPQVRERLAKWSLHSESEPSLRRAVALAASERGIPVLASELDADPWVLNVRNGVVDLRTGTLRPHARELLCTKLAPVDYDPQATCPRFERFLHRIFDGDQELIAFLQRLFGVTAIGAIVEQILALAVGAGANGKSTLLRILQKVLGDYAHQAPPDLLMHRDRHGGPTPDLADLQSRRLVVAIETGELRRLDEALVKALTGGDVLNARRLYANPTQFEPSHTIVLATNHLPTIVDPGHAIWRRVLTIPFNVAIPPAEQIDQHTLLELLWQEAPGILRWIINGCLDWQRQGLNPPEAVKVATATYREAMDILGGWISDNCTVGPTERDTPGRLYDSYATWATANGDEPISKKTFGARLEAKGYTRSRTGGQRYWNGLSVTRSDA